MSAKYTIILHLGSYYNCFNFHAWAAFKVKSALIQKNAILKFPSFVLLGERLFVIGFVGTSMIRNCLQYKNCSCSSSLVKSLLYNCVKTSPCSALLLVTLKFLTINYEDRKLSIFDQNLGSWRRKLESSQRISKFLCLASPGILKMFVFQKTKWILRLFQESFHHLYAIAWQPCAASFQTKQYFQKAKSSNYISKRMQILRHLLGCGKRNCFVGKLKKGF